MTAQEAKTLNEAARKAFCEQAYKIMIKQMPTDAFRLNEDYIQCIPELQANGFLANRIDITSRNGWRSTYVKVTLPE
jgi:type IV secretory pathway VirB4 component